MSEVIGTLGNFMLFALMAVFVENAVFTRGLGVSRLVKLVGDSAMDSVTFCSLLCLIQVISAPLAFFVNQWLAGPTIWFRDYVRPLALLLCALAAFVLVMLFVLLFRPRNAKELLAVLPMASFNCAVLGPMLIAGSQSFTFEQSIGFALGSGLGYGLAVLIVTEGQRKMNSRQVPATFRGLPINLLYIGILALAIYGLTGHQATY